MTTITEEMIETAYGIFFTEDRDIEPLLALGMNKSSANMTIVWLEKLFSGEPNKRTGSAMQIQWILNKLYEEKDFTRLAFSLESMNRYLDFYEDKPMKEVRRTVKEFESLLKFHNSRIHPK